jgi:hypothetical protein
MKEIHGIHDILLREKNGSFSLNSRLYQDILRYFFVVNNNSNNDGTFRFSELANWLIDNNSEIVNYYKDLSSRNTNRSNRVEARKDRIKSKLFDLINLDLIQVSGKTKAKTIDTNIDLYKYSEDGRVIAWLLQSMDPEKRENADNQIFEILCSKLEKIGSTDSLFCVAIFKTMKERGLFGKFADLLRQVLNDSTPVRNVSDLLSAVRVSNNIKEAAKNNPSAAREDLYAIIRRMDLKRRKLFFHQVKLDVENRMQNIAENPAGYEELRFSIADKPWLVATEGRCKKCKHLVEKEAELLPYMELRVAQRTSMVLDCPDCEEERSVLIPIL